MLTFCKHMQYWLFVACFLAQDKLHLFAWLCPDLCTSGFHLSISLAVVKFVRSAWFDVSITFKNNHNMFVYNDQYTRQMYLYYVIESGKDAHFITNYIIKGLVMHGMLYIADYNSDTGWHFCHVIVCVALVPYSLSLHSLFAIFDSLNLSISLFIIESILSLIINCVDYLFHVFLWRYWYIIELEIDKRQTEQRNLWRKEQLQMRN